MKNQTNTEINPSEYGIEPKQSKELMGNLPQIKSERSLLEEQFSNVITLDINDKQTSKIARELRLKIRDNRTKGILVWHKTSKDFFLRGGQFIDAVKNREIAVNERMENDLQQIENYFEILEQKRIDELREKRKNEIEPFIEFIPTSVDFGTISEDEFNKIVNGAKLLQAEAEKEKIRIEQEKIRIEQEREADRIRIQNMQRELELEKQRQKELENELNKKREEEKILLQKIEEEERIKHEAIILEQKRQKELLKLPVKKQLNEWVSNFSLDYPIGKLKDEKVVIEIHQKFAQFVAWSKAQINNM